MNPTLNSLIAEIVPAWMLPLDLAANPDEPEQPPMPAPTWKPEIKEPDDLVELPDEVPLPNPDENREPAKHADDATPPQPFPAPLPDPQPDPAPGPNPVPGPLPL